MFSTKCVLVVVIMGCFAAYGHAGIVKTMEKSLLLSELSKYDENGLTCYITALNGDIVQRACDTNYSECGIATFDVLSESGNKRKTEYFCGTPVICSDPTGFCSRLNISSLHKISNCDLHCCGEDLCNKPKK